MENQWTGDKAPTAVLPTVPIRKLNGDYRSREYLTLPEVDLLVETAKRNRWGLRDSLMILMAFRHGLRRSELCSLQSTQIDFNRGVLHVNRAKNGSPSVQPLTGKELRALRKLQREGNGGSFVFMSERNAPISPEGFARMLTRVAKAAGLDELKVHPHALRHSTGFYLANERQADTRSIQAYLGHRNITHTVRYTELRSDRFNGFFKD
jgi:type 1 fimbriae regulatory protein FimB/type 1 fimbriae regulatory protein FimE